VANIAGVAVNPATLFDLDSAYPGWQGASEGVPVDLGVVGPNLIALRPVPDAVYGLTFDVVRNAPIPTVDGDPVQIGREEIEPILDFAEATALFKVAEQAEDRMQRFYAAAITHNARLRASAPFMRTLIGQSRAEETERPRLRETQEV